MHLMKRATLAVGLMSIALLTANTAGASPISYIVTVNTAAVNGTSGFLDFQFNPGNATSQAATAVVSNFSGGSQSGVPSTTGNVSATLPGTVTFMNSTALNEYFGGFHYGSSFSFLLTLSGPALTSPNGIATAGTTFGLGLYDSSQNPILTNQGNSTGFAGQVDINLNGTTTPTAFPSNGQGGASVVSFQVATPEPGTLLSLGLGFASLWSYRRMRRSQSLQRV